MRMRNKGRETEKKRETEKVIHVFIIIGIMIASEFLIITLLFYFNKYIKNLLQSFLFLVIRKALLCFRIYIVYEKITTNLAYPQVVFSLLSSLC